MHVVITGGRDYQFTKEDRDWLDNVHKTHHLEMVIQGGAEGADKCAAVWAHDNGIPCVTFHANWTGEGKSAGPKRNTRMLRYLTTLSNPIVIAFPGGKGTANCVRQARELDLEVCCVEEDNE